MLSPRFMPVYKSSVTRFGINLIYQDCVTIETRFKPVRRPTPKCYTQGHAWVLSTYVNPVMV